MVDSVLGLRTTRDAPEENPFAAALRAGTSGVNPLAGGVRFNAPPPLSGGGGGGSDDLLTGLLAGGGGLLGLSALSGLLKGSVTDDFLNAGDEEANASLPAGAALKKALSANSPLTPGLFSGDAGSSLSASALSGTRSIFSALGIDEAAFNSLLPGGETLSSLLGIKSAGTAGSEAVGAIATDFAANPGLYGDILGLGNPLADAGVTGPELGLGTTDPGFANWTTAALGVPGTLSGLTAAGMTASATELSTAAASLGIKMTTAESLEFAQAVNSAITGMTTAELGAVATSGAIPGMSMLGTAAVAFAPVIAGMAFKSMISDPKQAKKRAQQAERMEARAPIESIIDNIAGGFLGEGGFADPDKPLTGKRYAAVAEFYQTIGVTPELAGEGSVMAEKLGFSTGNGDVGGDISRTFGRLIGMSREFGFEEELNLYADGQLSKAEFTSIAQGKMDSLFPEETDAFTPTESIDFRAEQLGLTGLSDDQALLEALREQNQPIPQALQDALFDPQDIGD